MALPLPHETQSSVVFLELSGVLELQQWMVLAVYFCSSYIRFSY